MLVKGLCQEIQDSDQALLLDIDENGFSRLIVFTEDDLQVSIDARIPTSPIQHL